MEYNYVQYQKAVQKALKEFDKQTKGKKMSKSTPTAPMTNYPKGKKPKKK